MKKLIKAALARTPYRITRRARGNRFSAVEDALASMAERGFAPRVVIDGGANVGAFSRYALTRFPAARVHAIEPQPGCMDSLRSLKAASGGRVEVHQVALGSVEQDGTFVTLATDESATSTGAHVNSSPAGETGRSIEVPCRSLDSLLAGSLGPDEAVFLKLDLQGYELQALRGAVKTLATCEAILTEVSFFAQAYEPPIAELVSFLDRHGFALYDIAAIHARPRDDRPRQGDFIFVRRGAALSADNSWS